MPHRYFVRAVHAVRIGKEYIERTGLSLGDALNAALFVLTVVSLLIAMAGVGIAWITYKDAKDGGTEQRNALKDAAESMRSARDELVESEKSLKAIRVVLDQQAEILSRTPKAKMSVECYGSEPNVPKDMFANFEIDSEHNTFADMKFFSLPPTAFSLLMRNSTVVQCYGDITNEGGAPLNSAFARIQVTPYNEATRPLSPVRYWINRGSGATALQIVNGKYILKASEPVSYRTSQYGSIGLFKETTVQPSSKNDTTHINFNLALPVGTTQVFIEWRFGGNEMKVASYKSLFELHSSHH